MAHFRQHHHTLHHCIQTVTHAIHSIRSLHSHTCVRVPLCVHAARPYISRRSFHLDIFSLLILTLLTDVLVQVAFPLRSGDSTSVLLACAVFAPGAAMLCWIVYSKLRRLTKRGRNNSAASVVGNERSVPMTEMTHAHGGERQDVVPTLTVCVMLSTRILFTEMCACGGVIQRSDSSAIHENPLVDWQHNNHA